jgi:hypothetical protein
MVLSSTTAGNRSWITPGAPVGQALTNVNDTNVTLSLGGTPASALLAAASLTLGWSGTLAAARLNANVVQSVVNDTNVTGSIASQVLTLGWTGALAPARGGVPTGGAAGTILKKNTATNYDTAWTSGPVALLGVTDGSAAGAGIIGETIRATLPRASQIALAANVVVNVLSIPLTAGDWDVRGNIIFALALPANTASELTAVISTTSLGQVDDGTQSYGVAANPVASTQASIVSVALPNRRISLTANTTIYLVGLSALLANGSGYIEARRISR